MFVLLASKGRKRIREIAGYLLFCFYEYVQRYVPNFFLNLVGFVFFRNFRYLLEFTPQQRLRISLEKLGPAYVKIGQMLSTRVDILPVSYIRELEKLQDKVPPEPIDVILEVLGDRRDWFEYFDPEPIGSGSVAQVHRARLIGGKEVAVKVIRPGARETIINDVEVLKATVSFLSKYFSFFRKFRILQIVDEFERMLIDELDLLREASYMELFRRFSKEESSFYVPEVYWEISDSNVLVSEFIKGTKLNDVAKSGAFDNKKLAKDFVRIVNKQIFELGTFHGDLHPGNIFVLSDGRIAFVDFGIIGRLSPDVLSEFFLFSLGVMNKDVDLIVMALKRIGAITENINEQLLKREILIFLDKYYNKPLSQIDAEKLFYEELSTARKFNVVLPEVLVVLMKTIAHTESIARLIDPDFRLPPVLKPYLKRLAARVILKDFRRRIVNIAASYALLFEKMPSYFEAKMVEKVPEKDYSLAGYFLIGMGIVIAFNPKWLLLYIPSSLITFWLLRRKH